MQFLVLSALFAAVLAAPTYGGHDGHNGHPGSHNEDTHDGGIHVVEPVVKPVVKPVIAGNNVLSGNNVEPHDIVKPIVKPIVAPIVAPKIHDVVEPVVASKNRNGGNGDGY